MVPLRQAYDRALGSSTASWLRPQWRSLTQVESPVGAPTPYSDEIVRLSWGIALAATVVQSVLYLIEERTRLDAFIVNADVDGSAWTWAAATATAVAGVGAILMAVIDRLGRRGWWCLAATCLFLSLDDAVAVHERAARVEVHLGLTDYPGRVVWPILYLPLLVVTAALLWRAVGAATGAAREAIRWGLGLLVAAVALEFGSGGLIQFVDYDHVLYQLEVVLEEGAELVGWMVIAVGMLATALAAAAERPEGR